MILGGWRSHHHAWTTYRKQRENMLRELDAIPCASRLLDDCDEKTTRHVEWLRSMIRSLALSEDLHLIHHRQQLADRMKRQQRRAA